MNKYTPSEIEKKWQDFWDEHESFVCENNSDKEKFYALVEFPYPSGQGLHVGHPRPYTALDIVSRMKRMQGYNVLFPMGWDAFGLPTENYAIKNKIHPAIVTKNNIAHKKEMPINWCPSCKVGLSNEEVVGGKCERCGEEVVRRVKSQWMLKITEYADRLINDLDDLDFIERVVTQQKNWIGRSEGASINFSLKDYDEKLEVFTTRPDTIYGATYMVIAPEHPLIENHADKIENLDEINAYKEECAKKSEFERTELEKNKTGVEIKGIKAINPLTNKEIPIWISDYVLMTYGTGAIMAVPAHDDRDYDFAKKFGLEIIPVIEGSDVSEQANTETATGKMINSGILNGLEVKDAIANMIDYLEENKLGDRKINYKLRDWVFSRQRYWGEPIPIVHCDKCGYVALPEEELPLLLPEVENYEPTDSGESPLAKMTDWVNTTCPKCGGPAKRETDTMPQWAGSSWYFLRYTDPHNDKELASKEALEYWTPVDWYNGGMEHTTLHLLYSRFWHKFLYDIGVVPTKEPYQKRTSHGMILGGNNEKMSKSRGNVVNPDDIVRDYGADTLRCYEMFIGDFEKPVPWSENGVKGCRRNTAIAQLMTLSNEFSSAGKITKEDFRTFLILLNPVAPHITEELWQACDLGGFLSEQVWPKYDEKMTIDDEIEIPVQFNGKVRYTVKIARDASQEEAFEVAEKDELFAKNTDGKNVVKKIYIPNKIVNIVVK